MGNWFSSLPGAIAQGLIWGIMAIGVYITYRILDIADLTVDGSICTGAAVCTVLIMRNINPWLALLCAFLVGLVAGSITGALHIGLGIPAILAGILTQMALWSVNLKILGKANQAIPARSYTVLLSQMDIPAALLLLGIATAAVIGILYLFFGTELGCGIRATGCNPAMSRAQGINTGVNKVIGLALSNGLVALSGGLLCQYQGYADVNMGRGAIVIGLASVILGEAIPFLRSRFSLRLIASVVGGVIYYLVITLVLQAGLDTNDLKLFSAAVVALALGIPNLRQKAAAKRLAKSALRVGQDGQRKETV